MVPLWVRGGRKKNRVVGKTHVRRVKHRDGWPRGTIQTKKKRGPTPAAQAPTSWIKRMGGELATPAGKGGERASDPNQRHGERCVPVGRGKQTPHGDHHVKWGGNCETTKGAVLYGTRMDLLHSPREDEAEGVDGEKV